eukprot:725228-Amphidinium_carterae.1
MILVTGPFMGSCRWCSSQNLITPWLSAMWGPQWGVSIVFTCPGLYKRGDKTSICDAGSLPTRMAQDGHVVLNLLNSPSMMRLMSLLWTTSKLFKFAGREQDLSFNFSPTRT